MGLRFLQAYKAKQSASRKWDEREAEADALARDACVVCERELAELVALVEMKCADAAVAGGARGAG